MNILEYYSFWRNFLETEIIQFYDMNMHWNAVLVKVAKTFPQANLL